MFFFNASSTAEIYPTYVTHSRHDALPIWAIAASSRRLDGRGRVMDRGESDRYRSLTRRTLVLGGMKLGLMGVLAARMYHLQVIDSERYHMLAEENRINMRQIGRAHV